MNASMGYLSERLPGVVMDNLVQILVSAALSALGLLFIEMIKVAGSKLLSISLLFMKMIEAAVGKLFGIFKVAADPLLRRLVVIKAAAGKLISIFKVTTGKFLEVLVSAKDLVFLVLHLEDEIKLLRNQLPDLKRVIMLSADEKPEDEEKRGVFRGFVEDAEDILDEFDARVTRLNQSKALLMKVAYKINGVYGALERAKSDLDRRRLVESARESLGVAREQSEELDSERGYCFLGREEEKKQIIWRLLGEPLSKPSVVVIAGAHGIGKTALVQHILGQPRVVQFFDLVKWVYVDDGLDIVNACAEICSELEGKRFLIVLDDLRSGNSSRWNEFLKLLDKGGDGTKVVVTSQETDFHWKLEGAITVRYLGSLSDEECLNIFESYAFEDSVPSDSKKRLLETTIDTVRRKINGVPLVARVLGSSLRGELREEVWNDKLTEAIDDNISTAFKWSYVHLPLHLKQCMALWSLFPKDHTFCKEHMIWMWIACGYVLHKDNKMLEHIGERYFEHLVNVNLIQPALYYEGRWMYTLHALVYEVILHGNLSIAKKPRALIYADISKNQLLLARVLSFNRVQPTIEVNFDTMIHLRYLDLYEAQFYTLPESICRINSLQTLLLHDLVENVPVDTWRLPNLRHLVGGMYIKMAGIGNSESLQTVGNFNLFTGRDLEELANLKELEGKLKINHLNHVTNRQCALTAELSNKEYITELVLQWGELSTLRSCERQNGILEDLRPHQKLRILEISCYMGDRAPSWMRMQDLSNLVKLTLSGLHHLKEIPPLGNLPSLTHLFIDDLRNVRCIDAEFYGNEEHKFPSLEELHLKKMSALEEWRDIVPLRGQPERSTWLGTWFPKVRLWEVSNCKKLTKIPTIPLFLGVLLISTTGLRVLPEPLSLHDSVYIRELRIHSCPSLYPDKWFRDHELPVLSSLDLRGIDRCTELVINYWSYNMRFLRIRDMAALESITLSRSRKSPSLLGYGFFCTDTILLERLEALKRVTFVNCEDGRIMAGLLELTSVLCNNRISLLNNDGSKFKPYRGSTTISGNFDYE